MIDIYIAYLKYYSITYYIKTKVYILKNEWKHKALVEVYAYFHQCILFNYTTRNHIYILHVNILTM